MTNKTQTNGREAQQNWELRNSYSNSQEMNGRTAYSGVSEQMEGGNEKMNEKIIEGLLEVSSKETERIRRFGIELERDIAKNEMKRPGFFARALKPSLFRDYLANREHLNGLKNLNEGLVSILEEIEAKATEGSLDLEATRKKIEEFEASHFELPYFRREMEGGWKHPDHVAYSLLFQFPDFAESEFKDFLETQVADFDRYPLRLNYGSSLVKYASRNRELAERIMEKIAMIYRTQGDRKEPMSAGFLNVVHVHFADLAKSDLMCLGTALRYSPEEIRSKFLEQVDYNI